jgi:hypothetical protein
MQEEEPGEALPRESSGGAHGLYWCPAASDQECFPRGRLPRQHDDQASTTAMPVPRHPLGDRLIAGPKVTGVHDHDRDGICCTREGAYGGGNVRQASVQEIRGPHQDWKETYDCSRKSDGELPGHA